LHKTDGPGDDGNDIGGMRRVRLARLRRRGKGMDHHRKNAGRKRKGLIRPVNLLPVGTIWQMPGIPDPEKGNGRAQPSACRNGNLGADACGFTAGQRDGPRLRAHGSRMIAAARSSFI
jgi:hypothetical protein